MATLVERTNHVVVNGDGELLSKQTDIITKNTSLSISLLYINIFRDGGPLLMKLSGSELKILLAVVLQMDFDGNVDLSASVRNDICSSVDIQKKTFRNVLSKLKNKNYLSYHSGSKVRINPTIFHVGKSRSVLGRREEYDTARRGVPPLSN